MNLNKTCFAEIYNSLCSATDELSKVRRSLIHFDYLIKDESKLLRKTLHLLYEKIVEVGRDIEEYKELETHCQGIPESEEEQI